MKSLTKSVAFVLFVLAVLPLRARAATFNIADGDVAGLKSAIASANASSANDVINLTVNGTYTLTTVDNNGSGPNGLPALGSDASDTLTINGNGATITRSAASGTPDFRILLIIGVTAVTLNDLTISNGSGAGSFPSDLGGGIDNERATLTMNHCTVMGNTGSYGGGIYNDGTNGSDAATLVMNHCTVMGNTGLQGGGIRSDGSNGNATLTLTNCTLSGNIAAGDTTYGAGIQNVGSGGKATLSLLNCTLVSNQSNGTSGAFGGGISNSGATAVATLRNTTLDVNSATIGGGIHNDHGVVNIINSTLSGNTASDLGGGIYNDGSSFGSAILTLFNSTVADGSAGGSGGGLFNDASSGGSATAIIGSTIFKTGGSGGNLVNATGTITSDGFNLSNDSFGGLLTKPTDLTSTNPKLNLIADYGGTTRTYALLPGSPAIDKGKSFASITTDQRGHARPYDNPAIANAASGDGTDIGAFEDEGASQPGPTFVVNTTDDHDDGFTGACTAGDCSLREAINDANAHAGTDTITFAAGVSGAINLASELPKLSTNLNVQGPGATVLTVQPATTDSFRVFTISNGTPTGPTVSISGLTIANGGSGSSSLLSSYGGGVLNDHGTVTVTYCDFSHDSAPLGGGITNYAETSGIATLTIQNSTFSNCTALGGASIFNDGSNSGHAGVTITNCTSSGNSSLGADGLDNDGDSGNATATVQNCTFNNTDIDIYNSASSGGAGVMLSNTILNGDGTHPNITNNNGAITSLGHNLSSDAVGGDGTTAPGGFLNATGDIRNTNPKLGPLIANGGQTDTLALLTGSPAINAGASSAPATDQRGFTRNGAPDIGAFEAAGTSPFLFLNVSPLLFSEAAGPNAARGTIARSGSRTLPVTINLSSSDTTEATVPASIVIPAGAFSVTFPIAAVNDNLIDGPQKVTIAGIAAGYTLAKRSVIVSDDEAHLGITVAPAIFGENGGTHAATGTVTRNTPTTFALAVKIDNGDKHRLTLPVIVVIPAGAASVTFPIGAIDDTVAEGPQRIKLTMHSKGYPTTSTTVTLTDNEANLHVTVTPSTFSEGAGAGAAMVTVTRNTLTTDPLAVSLASSNVGAVKVPSSLTIPAGATSMSVPLTAIDNHVVNAPQSVNITASATALGYAPGQATVTVTDND